MRLADYYELLESLTSEDCDGTTASLKCIQEKFPNVSHSTLVSIYSQHCQMITRQTYHQHNNPDMISYYVQVYQARIKQDDSSPVLIQMAKEANMPPAVIARFVVEGSHEKASNQEGMSLCTHSTFNKKKTFKDARHIINVVPVE
eukprot:XP_011678121.1 PREDICTED: uncharacterized protein C15orf41 homolog [Strongylocentrotus purpuratus]